MHGQRTKTFRRSVEVTESGHLRTTLNDQEVPMMGRIWQDQIVKDRRKRDWTAFYLGCIFTTLVFFLVALFLTRLTGGECS